MSESTLNRSEAGAVRVPDVFVRCDDCGWLPPREHRRGGAVLTFAARCPTCDDDPAARQIHTTVTTLVPVAVFKDCDEWRIRVLSDEEVQRARAASDWIARGFCPRCQRVREGHEEDCGTFSETHLRGRCARCKAPTEAMTLEPSCIGRSASDDEWYVVVLEDDELAHVRLGLPFPSLLCSWTS